MRADRVFTTLLYFNPRSHERSDAYKTDEQRYSEISIHAPTRGATGTGRRHPHVWVISIHAPTRGATGTLTFKQPLAVFQSTLPREERPQETRMSDIHSNFNPRSHERSDSNIKTPRRQKRISIHAPTRGATTTSQTSCIKALDFNPRSHERSDVALYVSCILVAVISIHAPTRGATGKRYIRRML